MAASAYEIYNAMTPDEKHRFYLKWMQYVESKHDTELEKNINNLNIEIEHEYKIFYDHEKDFEVKTKNNPQDLDEMFWYRAALKNIFEKGFRWTCIKEKSSLYKRIAAKHPRALRSPNTNICGNDRTQLCLFIKDNSIYVAAGTSFYKNTTTQYFDYIGRILEKGEVQQLSIFDF